MIGFLMVEYNPKARVNFNGIDYCKLVSRVIKIRYENKNENICKSDVVLPRPVG